MRLRLRLRHLLDPDPQLLAHKLQRRIDLRDDCDELQLATRRQTPLLAHEDFGRDQLPDDGAV